MLEDKYLTTLAFADIMLRGTENTIDTRLESYFNTIGLIFNIKVEKDTKVVYAKEDNFEDFEKLLIYDFNDRFNFIESKNYIFKTTPNSSKIEMHKKNLGVIKSYNFEELQDLFIRLTGTLRGLVIIEKGKFKINTSKCGRCNKESVFIDIDGEEYCEDCFKNLDLSVEKGLLKIFIDPDYIFHYVYFLIAQSIAIKSEKSFTDIYNELIRNPKKYERLYILSEGVKSEEIEKTVEDSDELIAGDLISENAYEDERIKYNDILVNIYRDKRLFMEAFRLIERGEIKNAIESSVKDLEYVKIFKEDDGKDCEFNYIIKENGIEILRNGSTIHTIIIDEKGLRVNGN